MQAVNCRLQTGYKLQTRYKMQTADWVQNADWQENYFFTYLLSRKFPRPNLSLRDLKRLCFRPQTLKFSHPNVKFSSLSAESVLSWFTQFTFIVT